MDIDAPTTGAPAPSQPPAGFTVVLQGVPFVLSRDQCEFDSPNYFTSAFGGDFEESATRIVHIDRSPILFRFIVDHLSGYGVIPLPPIPSMHSERATKNLLLDAQYFGLSKLEREIQIPPATPDDDLNVLRALGYARRVEVEDLASGAIRLERDPSKWAVPPGNSIPLVGSILPPLIRIKNVTLTFAWDVFYTNRTFERTTIKARDLVTIVEVPPISAEDAAPPLQLSQATGLALHEAQDGDDASHPLPLLSLDGENADWKHFREAIQDWRLTTPTTPATTLRKLLHGHLNFIHAEREDDQGGSSCTFDLFADEIWVTPTRHQISDSAGPGGLRLDAVGYSLVSAKMTSRPTMLRELLKAV